MKRPHFFPPLDFSKGDVQSILGFYADLYQSRQNETHLLNNFVVGTPLKDETWHIRTGSDPDLRLGIPFRFDSKLGHASVPPLACKGEINRNREDGEILNTC